MTLWANGQLIGEGNMPHTVPVAFSSYAGMDVGCDNGLVVDRAYEDKAPCAFTGTVKKVVFDLKPATNDDERACTNTRTSKPSAREPLGEVKKQIEDRDAERIGGMMKDGGGLNRAGWHEQGLMSGARGDLRVPPGWRAVSIGPQIRDLLLSAGRSRRVMVKVRPWAHVRCSHPACPGGAERGHRRQGARRFSPGRSL